MRIRVKMENSSNPGLVAKKPTLSDYFIMIKSFEESNTKKMLDKEESRT